MKVKLTTRKKSKLHSVNRDGARRSTLKATLLRASEKTRRKELAERGKVHATITHPTTKLTVRLNKSGDLRGTNPNSHSAKGSEEMKRIRAMRKLYNKQMPNPQCNNCSMAQSCPQYRAGYECAFLPFLQSHKVDTIEDMVTYMKDLLGSNMRRAQQTVLMETLSGGTPSLETSEQLALLFSQLKDLANLEMEMNSSEMILETDDKSIIGKIFGGIDNLIGDTEAAIDGGVDAREPLALPAVMNDQVIDAEIVNTEVLDDYVRSGLDETNKRGKTAKPRAAQIEVAKLSPV